MQVAAVQGVCRCVHVVACHGKARACSVQCVWQVCVQVACVQVQKVHRCLP